MLSFPDREVLPLTSYLEQVTVLLLQVCAIRSKPLLQNMMERYFAPSLEVEFPDPYREWLHTITREAYAEKMFTYICQFPFFRSEAFNTTAVIQEGKRTARVFTTNRLSGIDNENPELTRETVVLYHFKRFDGDEWYVVRGNSLL